MRVELGSAGVGPRAVRGEERENEDECRPTSWERHRDLSTEDFENVHRVLVGGKPEGSALLLCYYGVCPGELPCQADAVVQVRYLWAPDGVSQIYEDPSCLDDAGSPEFLVPIVTAEVRRQGCSGGRQDVLGEPLEMTQL